MDTAQDVDEFVVTMGEALNEPLRCQSRHGSPDSNLCSISVVAYIVGCRKIRFYICANAVANRMRYMMNPINRCKNCQRPAHQCWTIVPC